MTTTITPKQLEAHRLWINGDPGGIRLVLARADLRDADLHGANLTGEHLYDANLARADLRDANLYGADLNGADLNGANLRGADLRGADLYGADLNGANLRGADLYGTCVALLLDNDGRGFQVVAHSGLLSNGETVYLAGCRKLTRHGAVAHWSNPDHHAPESAAKILAAIEAHHATTTTTEG